MVHVFAELLRIREIFSNFVVDMCLSWWYSCLQ